MADAQLRAVISGEDRLSPVLKKVEGSLNTVDSQLGGMRDRLQKVGEGMTSIGTRMSTVITAPLVGLGVYGVKAFSDLSEAVNASNVVFGEASGKIMDFGKTAAESVGLSQRAFLQASVPIGSALQNVGVSATEAGDMTIQLTERAADMASVFNTDVGTALGAIQAGLRGEIDPLEKFGVGLNESSLKAYALANGIGTADAELTLEEKTLARVGLIMEQTDRVQGDFANTSDGLANSTRIAKAELENNAAILGGKLAPMVSEAIKYLNDLIDKWKALSPEVQDNILKVMGVIAIVGPLLVILGTLAGSVAALAPLFTALGVVFGFVAANPIVLLIGALVLIGLGIKKMMDQTGGAKEFFRQTWDGIKIIWRESIDSIVDAFQPLFNVIDRAKSALSSVKSFVGGAVGKIVGPVFKPRAFGGAVNPNQPFLVGERGPELFTPSNYGNITRNSQIGGGGITVIVNGDISGQDLIDKVSKGIMNQLKQNVQV